MSVTAEDITNEFLEFDIEVSDEVLCKLVEIASIFSFSAEDLLNEWVAYQSRNEHPILSYTELEHLEQELTSSKSKSRLAKPNMVIDDMPLNGRTESVIEDMLVGYCSPGNKQKLEKFVTTPVRLGTKKECNFLSPSIFSPLHSNKSSQKYSNRSNSGEIVVCLSETKDFILACTFQPSKACKIIHTPTNAQKTFKYMFQKMIDLCDILNDAVEQFAEEVIAQTEVESWAPCSAPCQGEIDVIGRIKSENASRLSPISALLDGDRIHSYGRSVSLELSKVNEYSIFPGQIVAMKGTNPSGKKLIVESMHAPKINDGKILPAKPDDFVSNDLSKVSFIVASGPFTTSDALTYEPLTDLIEIVKKDRPDVTLLIGPLIDANHQDVQSGSLSESFSELSSKYFKTVRNELESFTQLVFVPSVSDVFHHSVYPQPPYFRHSSEKCHFLPNPCVFNADDIRITATSADILFHLGAEEISRTLPSGSSDRLTRLIHHLFTQKSFYPLYPPHESIPLDIPAAEFGCKLPPDFDVLILPSDLRCFAKCVKGRLCLNPGRLAKGPSGGTYARVTIDSERKAMAQIVTANKNISTENGINSDPNL